MIFTSMTDSTHHKEVYYGTNMLASFIIDMYKVVYYLGLSAIIRITDIKKKLKFC